MGTLLLALVLGQNSVQIAPAVTPAQACEAAAADLATLPAELRKHTRYLWLGNSDDKQWADAWRVLGFHVNHLSREPEIVSPRVLPCRTVAAISLLDYQWNAATWEKLADSEPYFRVRTVQKAAKGKEAKEKTVTLLAPWVAGPALQALVDGCQSEVPLVRADWFVWQTAINADRGDSGYYAWLGVKDEGDFDKLVGFDAETLKRFPRTAREAVIESGVTRQSRRIDFLGTVGGLYAVTADTNLAAGKGNPLQFLNGGFEYKARESLGHLPNGMIASGLFDAKGARQDSAPPEIASDSTSPTVDKRVHVGLSCVSCHGPHAGWQPVQGFVRSLAQKPLAIQSPDYAAAKKLQRLYASDLETVLDDARRPYVRAVAKATGWEPKVNATKYAEYFYGYDSPLDVGQVARELGVAKETMLTALKERAASGPAVDPVIGILISDKPMRIPRQMWHESFQQAMELINRERR